MNEFEQSVSHIKDAVCFYLQWVYT